MRILMTTDAVGGVWQYSLDLAAGLSRRGAEITLAVLGPGPAGARRAEAMRIPELRLIDTGLPLDWVASSSREVRDSGEVVASLAQRSRADLVHLNSPALASAHFDLPVVAVCHSCVATWWSAVRTGPLPEDFVWRAQLTRQGLSAANQAVAPSRAFAQALVDTYALTSPPVVVHNGRGRVSARQDGAAHGETFAFSAGRLWDEGKNITTLEKAAAGLSIKVRVAGPLTGPNGAHVELRNVEALGNLSSEAIASWLTQRPIFVSTALYEPFGLAALEAAQAGCPLILTDIPTFRELWDGTALFVDPRDDRALASAIRELAKDGTGQERLGAAAAARARRYTVDAMANRMSDIYHRVLGQSAEHRAVA